MRDESADLTGRMDRRDFLGKGAGALAAAGALGDGQPAPRPRVLRQRRPRARVVAPSAEVGGAAGQGQDDAGAAIGGNANAGPAIELPTRKLGRTGASVTILTQGTWLIPGGERLLRFAWANGVRYVDTADNYGSEPMIARWMQAAAVPRNELFLVTKTRPQSPQQLLGMLDQRLQALQVDYVDAILIHALGDMNFNAEVNWPNSPEFKQTADAIRKSGKAKFVGFSTHHPYRAALLQSAAAGGFVDLIMLQNNPWMAQDDAMNRALDAASKAGIGLISMKQVAGNMNLDAVAQALPELAAQGLSPYQALLHAIWTDERFTSVAVSMRNTDQIRENTAAAQAFRPLKQAAILRLRDACIAARPTMCASCDGRCSQAAGTTAELGNLARFLTYHDHHGHRAEARRLYAGLEAAARDWQGADLEAARRACPNRLDFARLLPRAAEVLG
jgi:aryl-alcohol dehydrogenase-like predicted oxidoreductase